MVKQLKLKILRRVILCFITMISFNQALLSQVTFVLADSAIWESKTAGYDSPGGWYVSNSTAALYSDSIFYEGYFWKLYHGEVGNVYVRSSAEKVMATQIQLSGFDSDSTYTLYDFGLEVGDTVYNIAQLTPAGNTNNHLILNAVYDTLMNGKTLKVYKFNRDTWIEHIGSIKGFLNPFFENIPLGAVFSLCHYQGHYTDSSAFIFDLELSYPATCMLSTKEFDKSELTYYVANDWLYIQGMEEDMEFAIYNLLGARKQFGFIESNYSTVPIHDLSTGFYLLNIGGQYYTFVK